MHRWKRDQKQVSMRDVTRYHHTLPENLPKKNMEQNKAQGLQLIDPKHRPMQTRHRLHFLLTS